MAPMRVPPRPVRCAGVTLVLAMSGTAASCGDSEPTAADLAGPDSSGNGVRDDIEALIDDFEDELHGYLLEVAANEQHVVIFDSDSADATRRAIQIAEEANRLVACLPEGVDQRGAREAAEKVRQRTADTSARRDRRAGFTAAIDGLAFYAPDCTAPPGRADPVL